MNNIFYSLAEVSEIQSSDIYMSVKARLFDLKTNKNGVRVTEAFMDEIVNNEDKYIGVQLYADVKGLINNETVGHMYNSRTGEFKSTPIGSFVHFEKELAEDNAYLIGTARIMKRNKAVCEAIAKLFADNALKFSFEINCGSYTQEDDGTIVIDASPANYLLGLAIVTMPACEDAVALQLVAELQSKGDEGNMENENMIDEEVVSEEVVSEEEVAEEEVASEELVAEEETAACGKKPKCGEDDEECDPLKLECGLEAECKPKKLKCSEEELTSECKKKKAEEEVALVVTTVEHREEDIVRLYDTETCESTTTVETKMVETTTVAEETAKQIALLKEVIEGLKNEIAEMKNDNQIDTIIAEIAKRSETKPNPFMAEMKMENKYSLLEREEKHTRKEYTLI